MDRVLSSILVVVTTLIVITNPQKVAPGVNPNNYQPPPQQQYQPPPPPQQVQYQQQPIQQQPMQQQPIQQQPIQQQPIQHQPVQQQPIQSAIPQEAYRPPPPPPQQQQQQQQQPHHDHHDQPQLLNAANLAEEREHMQEHLNVNIDTSKMTEQELQFHYFKMHDADNNNKLDGCELIKSLIHWHEQGHQDPSTGHQTPPREKIFTDEELSNLIDPILNMDDANTDGYIDYPEFVRAQQKAAAAAQAQQANKHS
ncbi:nuclear transcription factor Y subunit beta-like isoform X2 [Homalodisca vitripennis]|uniref:nuclear transcription factor Y subunit beta-like isoform X2 n=1 Tax=Homalodisca vitripennis TaxID=197043 RepID=UPI001EEA6596|nr:nuclear transcription factor Y subunit beta-like isoform X2 [Homalodisca vitripennis]